MTLKKQPFRTLLAHTLVLLLLLCIATTASAQTLPPFDSGSTGSDGALSLTTPGTYLFDPNDTVLFGRALDIDGDGIFNFTTITIGSGVTLRFRGDRYNRPVIWLASGAVSISGVLDLKGGDAFGASPLTDLDVRRKLTVPGSGGFSGGAGGHTANPAVVATAGDGPGGGITTAFNPCQNIANRLCGSGGTLAGTNRYLVPLIGGSGGGGGTFESGGNFEMAGAGGGGILISSSNSINFPSGGQIDARGGSESYGGGGSGGAVRLVAPTISMFTVSRVLVNGGALTLAGLGAGGDGRARLEAFQFVINGSAVSTGSSMVSPQSAATSGLPTNSYVPPSSVRIVSIDGQAVSATPSGTFLKPPDVTINKSVAVPVVVQAVGIPATTPINVIVYSDNPDDPLTISTTYSGTLDSNLQSVVNIPFPFGLSRSYIRVTWTQ